MTTALATRKAFLQTATQELAPMMPRLVELLPPDIPPDQFKAGLVLYLSEHAGELAECAGQSLHACVLKAALRGLLPGRDCHFLGFRDRRRGNTKVATFVPTYEGIILALERSGKVRKAFANAVYSRDRFTVDYLADVFSHQPHLGADRGELTCFYGCILMKDGSRHVQVVSLAEVDAIKARAPAHDSGPWATHYVAMARKTALKQVAKYVHLTPQTRELLDEDDARELTDPSPLRAQTLIAEMWGEEPAPNTPPDAREATRVPRDEGGVREHTPDANLGHPGAPDEQPDADGQYTWETA